MNTRILMLLSAGVLGIAGLALTFAPVEISGYLGLGTAPVVPLLLQVLGSLYLGFGMVNWMLKGSLIGGIYNRPAVGGNILHFGMTAMVLIRLIAKGSQAGWMLVAAAVYILFAVWFGLVLFRHPVARREG
jgi:hypothetical protein